MRSESSIMDDETADSRQTDRRPRREKSLLARALGYLARREYSRAELARKLAPHAESPEQLVTLLTALEAKNLLSEARFVEVLARSRGARFGAARIRQELRAHQVHDDVAGPAIDALRQSEFERARALWDRKFGTAAADAVTRVRQMRFLAGRGFSTEVIRKVVKGVDPAD
jgi:regulatory protein